MDLLNHLLIGFENAVTWTNLLYCFVGVTLGTLVGVLPGMGPVATVAMLLPITYALDPSTALIMLAGIYYGAQYGGSTTAILVNIPGEASAVVTCLDGHRLALAGRAGAALGIAAIGSFIAGCFATVVIAAFAEPLTQVAFQFGPREYFSLMGPGPGRRCCACIRLAPESGRHDPDRHSARLRRHGCQFRSAPLCLRY